MKITLGNNGNMYAGFGGFVTQVVVMTLATILATYILPGVTIDNVLTAIITATIIALLNNFIRPILIVITLPFTVFTMGFFLLVINAVIILLAAALVPRFHVATFWDALLFSLLLTFFNYLLELPNRLSRRPKYQPSDRQSIDPHTDTDEDGFSPYEDVTDQNPDENKQ